MPDQSSYIGMLLRKIVRRFVRIYYPAIHVSHPERLPREGATLYIANHSNSLIDPVIVEVPNPIHPYGVRGVGETPIVPPLATVANAMRSATGVRFEQLPMSPPRVLAALEGRKG